MDDQARSVAVIGAGISGIAAAAHLQLYGLRATVFERTDSIGGVWHFNPAQAIEPSYPQERPTQGHALPSTSNDNSETQEFVPLQIATVKHAPPGPCYAGLRNNVPTTLMRSSLLNWPEGTEEHVTHKEMEEYIQELAKCTGVRERIMFDTSVEIVYKPEPSSRQWCLHTKTLDKSQSRKYSHTYKKWDFDAVVVASGHYHMPLVPRIQGLASLKQAFPERVLHSKIYRRPEPFKDKRVLIVGGGVSSLDIAKDLSSSAKKVYQSTRGGTFDLPSTELPSNAERVGPIASFSSSRDRHAKGSSLGTIFLRDGRCIEDVDVVILATGYLTSYPFLGPLQDPTVEVNDAGDHTIITADGCITHNLYQDIFYIPDPSLAFVGVPYHISTFSLFDFQAEVVARVFAGQAELPPETTLRRMYGIRRASLDMPGSLKTFHSLLLRELDYIKDILAWINKDAVRLGHAEMSGPDSAWRERYAVFCQRIRSRRGLE